MNKLSAVAKAGCLTGLLGLIWVGAAAQAQGVPYKVVGADGRITYTDRPNTGGKSVQALGTASPSAPVGAHWLEGLPFGLKQVAQRYPVTLYTGPGCPPCDMGRQLLQQRGVPFKEWRVPAGAGNELRSREGTASLPVLRVGGEQSVGFESAEWRKTLDAAGYPAQSALPASWQPPVVQSLAAPGPVDSAMGSERLAPATPKAPVPEDPAPAAGGFRF